MTTFIINDRTVNIDLCDGRRTLKTIREELHLTGTKESCGEGNCGACMVLLGAKEGRMVRYKAMTSCLIPAGELRGRHVVTIEGLNRKDDLGLIQETFVQKFASQCGFCTPGFIISLTGYLLNADELREEDAIAAIAGNICRCTGYGSIKRAVSTLLQKFDPKAFATAHKTGPSAKIKFLIEKKVLPEYFADIQKRLSEIPAQKEPAGKVIVGGATDLSVQKKDEFETEKPVFLSYRDDLHGVKQDGRNCVIGGATTLEDLRNSPVIAKFYPEIKNDLLRVASLPIRNRATVAGNIINASPIGDLSVLLLALDAMLVLSNGKKTREVPLRDFFKGYKKTDKKEGEILEQIYFEMPEKNTAIHFEKVSKRPHLDIASVNTAICIQTKKDHISKIGISAGGVGPFPLYISKTCELLNGKKITPKILKEAFLVADSEISPISDVRGSERYKRLLLQNLLTAHFLALFPEKLKDISL